MSDSAESSVDDLAIGIDLGTTFSAIAFLDREDGEFRIIDVEGGLPTMPSIVLYGPDKVEVGVQALRKFLTHQDGIVRWAKRAIGTKRTFTIQRTPDGEAEQITPEEASAEILRKIVADAEEYLGRKITKVVITVPAWFDAKAKAATSRAGELAGLEVIRTIEEPTAAAICWGYENLKDNEKLLVYDLGGGTFDCSILEYEDGELQRNTRSMGNRECGGHDWTERLVEKTAEKFAEKFGEDPMLDPRFATELYEQCEAAKKWLSNAKPKKDPETGEETSPVRSIAVTLGKRQSATIEVTKADVDGCENGEELAAKILPRLKEANPSLPDDDGAFRRQLAEECGLAWEKINVGDDDGPQDSCSMELTWRDRDSDSVTSATVDVTQEEFESWTESLLQTTLLPVEDGLNLAGLTWDDINHVLLVGGSVRLRRVHEVLKELSGKDPILLTSKVDEMVALGAAMVAAAELGISATGGGTSASGEAASEQTPISISETTNFALGIVTVGSPERDEPPFKNTVVIEEGTKLPCETTCTTRFKTVKDNQELFKVPIVEGSDPDATFNILNMTYLFECLPDTPKGSEIEVTVGYDISQQVVVTARDVRTGTDMQGSMIEFEYPQSGGGVASADICFVIDATSSMGGCMEAVKQTIGDFCQQLNDKSLPVRLGLVEFRDEKIHEDTRVHGWTDEVSQFREWVSGIKARGGGDLPESALDGVGVVTDMEWRDGVPKSVVLITDAPCHVPDQKGRNATDVGRLLQEHGIRTYAIAPRYSAYEELISGSGGDPGTKGSDADLVDFREHFRGTVNTAKDINLLGEKLMELGGGMIEDMLAIV